MSFPQSVVAQVTINDTMSSFLLEPFRSGALPNAFSLVIDGLPRFDELVPADAVVLWRHDTLRDRDWVVEGDGWRARIEGKDHSNFGTVRVVASTPELARRVVDEISSRCIQRPVANGIDMTVWLGKGDSRRRHVSAQPWSDVARNYPFRARHALEQLVRHVPNEHGGRIVLLHGEPGTGKTTLIRSLLWEWRTWARADIVTDGDALLHDPTYLGEVTGRQNDERWQVVIVEDAGNLVDEDALFGGDLSRLLNASDGIVGMGTKTLFVLTTNEKVGTPQRALTRPGRCIANIECTRFTRTEAIEWLGGSADVPYDGLTLAELYERTSEATVITNVEEPAAHGVYL